MRTFRNLGSLTGYKVRFGALLMLSAAYLFTVQASPIEVPLGKRGGIYTVPIHINGVITLDFVLDTGASDVAIPADVFLTLLRTGTIRDEDFLPGESYQLADGSTVKSPRFNIRDLEVAGHKINNDENSGVAMLCDTSTLKWWKF